MRGEDVQRLAERITTLGSWTDAASDELAMALAKLADLRAAEQAVDELVATWDAAFRPPIARLLTMYRVKLETAALREAPAVQSWVTVPPSRGYDIAMAAYVQDCKERRIEVNVDKFHRFLGPLLGKQAQEPEIKFGVAPKPRDPSGPEREEDF